MPDNPLLDVAIAKIWLIYRSIKQDPTYPMEIKAELNRALELLERIRNEQANSSRRDDQADPPA